MVSADEMQRLLEGVFESLDAAIRTLVRANPGIEVEELVEQVTEVVDIERFADLDTGNGTSLEDLIPDLAYSHVFELCDQHGPLIETADGKLLDLVHMVTGKVFTHRMSALEADLGALVVDFDLWALSGCERLRVDSHDDGYRGDTEIEVLEDNFAQRWTHASWEHIFVEDSTIAIGVDAEGTARIRTLDASPPVDPGIAESLRSAYELHCEASDRPPSSDLLVAEMLLDEPTTFDQPTAPLSEYAQNLGLEVRRSVAGDSPLQWRTLAEEQRLERMTAWFDPSTSLDAQAILRVAEQVAAGEPPDDSGPEGEPGADADSTPLGSAVESLASQPVREAVSDEWFAMQQSFLPTADPAPFLDAALEVASTGPQRATVHFMRHRLEIHRGRLDAAEDELRRAVEEDPEFADPADRLAWFASVRGDAATAVGLWESIEHHEETDANLAVIRPFAKPGPKPGRNEPCWCGSGLKYKKCHLGTAPMAALEKRVPWLWRKAFGFVATTGVAGRQDMVAVATARAADPQDMEAIDSAFSDPLTIDLVLTECGYLEAFIDIFGELLPADELRLAASWTGSPRSIHEVVRSGTEGSVALRDIRTAEVTEVTDGTGNVGNPELRPGMLVCARLVPDGVGHQVIGAVFEVTPGTETALIEVLDTARSERDGAAVAQWVAESERSTP